MTRYVDFRKLKERVSILDVVQRYGFPLTEKGASREGDCPLCAYTDIGEADQDSRKFKVNPAIGAFKCFGCGAGGNVIDLVAKREKTTIQRAAVVIAEWFGIHDCDIDRSTTTASRVPQADVLRKESHVDADKQGRAQGEQESLRHNQPLDWGGLKSLQFDHESILELGFQPEVLEELGVGHCSRGMMAGRLACPIRNREGELLGYCGIALDEREPRVKFPPPAKFERGIDFFLYDRSVGRGLWEDGQPLFIADSVLDALHLHQQEYRYVISSIDGAPTRQQLLRLREDAGAARPWSQVLFVSREMTTELKDAMTSIADCFYVGFVSRENMCL